MIAVLLGLYSGASEAGAPLPGAYFRLMEAGARKAEARLNAMPGAGLKELEAERQWRHFPYAILPPAVLYAKQHPDNSRYHDRHLLELTVRIGDLLASESEKGVFGPRLDSDWDTYMWLEAYRLLEPELGERRRDRWQREIAKNIEPFVEQARERLDFPWYNSPYISTSPNHYALWGANLLLGGIVFGNKEWKDLGSTILRRFAAVEQTPDGYWGEHSRAGPTTGYDHLTLSAVALYWEYSHDPDALAALRRSTDFHKYFTYPDGTPVEVINDRNRYWAVSAWGQFAFTAFPDGRRYAEFLTGFFRPESLTVDEAGRLAQDALYYHSGEQAPIPQEQPSYWRMLNVPAGIRKTGPWVVCLSGIISTQAVFNQFYLDRQANLSVFHEKLGQIISGANSKKQPELATIQETARGQKFHLPISSRLEMEDSRDRLSLAYNTFWISLEVPPPSEKEMQFRFWVNGRGRPPEEATLTLQLALRAGEIMETGAGQRVKLSDERIEYGSRELGGWIRHGGWTLEVDPTARLVWPIYPYNPYSDAPEKTLEHAVAALSVPLRFEYKPGRNVLPREQEIAFKIMAR